MPQPQIWAEINLTAIAHNVRQLRRITNEHARLLVAVKANGYGHGAVEVARTALASGADQLGVARLEEAVALRKAGIRAPILIMGYTHADQILPLMNHGLTATLYCLENAREISKAAMDHQAAQKIHIKVDSGMGRLGIPCQDLTVDSPGKTLDDICAISELPGLELGGIFTHFATADHSNKVDARQQFDRFQKLLAELEDRGIDIPIKHAANSGAIIDMPETHLDMVRAGISVYGLLPSREVDQTRIDLQPALALKAKIIHLKRVPAGTKISYGGTWEAKSPTTIATVPVGYGDGYSRLLSNKGQMLVRGQKAPIAGRVCMDLTMLDVGRVNDAAIGDEVVLIGEQGSESITADEVAEQLGTINYEVVTGLMSRVKRVYSHPLP